MKNERRICAAVLIALGVGAACAGVPAHATQDTTTKAASAADDPLAGPESSALSPPDCGSLAAEIPQPKLVAPVVNVSDFGAKGDGVTDDTGAISRAIQSMKGGGTLVFEKGKTYFKTGNILVNTPGVHIWGYGATIRAKVPAPADLQRREAATISIQLNAPRAAVYGLTIISNLRGVRQPANGGGIIVAGPDQEVIDNRVEYTGAGIFIRFGTNFIVARNVVYRTAADGIHVTSGSRDGRVLCNTVRENGDDMIAVVNYGQGEPSITNIRIEGNDVAGNYWGRGITVDGGKDVTIRRNRISETTNNAAIYIVSEISWKTANVRNVLVEENEIRDAQMTTPRYNPRTDWRRNGDGAIAVKGYGSQEVRQVIVRNNKITRSYPVGIAVIGNACDIGIEGNAMNEINGLPMKIQTHGFSGECRIACSGNTMSGASLAQANCSGPMPDVRGARQ